MGCWRGRPLHVRWRLRWAGLMRRICLGRLGLGPSFLRRRLGPDFSGRLLDRRVWRRGFLLGSGFNLSCRLARSTLGSERLMTRRRLFYVLRHAG